MLLLDEPLSALDAKVRAQLRDEIRRIQLEVGITTLFVTHDQEEALAIADRVGVMRAGRLEQLGAPARGLRAAGHPVRRRVRRADQPAAGHGARAAPPTGWAAACRCCPAAAHRPAGRVLVRPEAVLVSPARAAGSGTAGDAAGAAGSVVSTSFLGALARVTLSTAGGPVVAQLSAAAASELTPGTAVTWRLLATAALAVPADSSA